VVLAPTDDLIGREAELSVGRQLIHTVRRGAAGSLLIEGEAGIGKTVLVQHIAAEGRIIGAASLSGAAIPLSEIDPLAHLSMRLSSGRGRLTLDGPALVV
jgi:replication-associated recombination protein RarA